MKKYIVFLTVFVACIFLSAAHIYSLYGITSFRIPKTKVDAVLQSRLPFQRPLLVYDLTVSKAALDLSTNKVAITADIDIQKKDCKPITDSNWIKAQKLIKAIKQKCDKLSKAKTTIEILALGTVSYDDAKFFFTVEKPDDIIVRTNYQDKFLIDHKTKIDLLLQRALFEYLNRMPVYELTGSYKDSLISMAIQSVETHSDYIQVNVSYLLLTLNILINFIVFMVIMLITFVLLRAGIIFK